MTFRHSRPSDEDGRRLVPRQLTQLRFPPHEAVDYRDRYRGAMVGTAVGDALGRPLEGMSSRFIAESFGYVTDYVPRNRLKRGPKGLVTDDTEMALCIAQSIVEHGQLEPEDLAERFRSWSLVGRGMGSATRAACQRIGRGDAWYVAGSDSAGNGAAMRAAPIALFEPFDMDALRESAALSAVITHNNPTAVAATIAAAYVVAHLLHVPSGTFDAESLRSGIDAVLAGVDDPALTERRDGRSETTLLSRIHDVFEMSDQPIERIYERTHNGAFVVESLPAALGAFLVSAEDPEKVITAAVNGGHDADTVGAMAGAFAGAYHGVSALPNRWVKDIEFRSGLEGVADELLHLADLGEPFTGMGRPSRDDYSPFVRDGKRWITRTHFEESQRKPTLSRDIRLLPHPASVRALVR